MMIGKRETSISVTDLQDFHNVSDSIKRLAISIDGHPSSSHSAEEFMGKSNSPVQNPTTTVKGATADNADAVSQNRVAKDSPAPENRVKATGAPIKSILSNARSDFTEKYELLSEIGRGGFSTVYQCQDKASGILYAVKVNSNRKMAFIGSQTAFHRSMDSLNMDAKCYYQHLTR